MAVPVIVAVCAAVSLAILVVEGVSIWARLPPRNRN